MGDYNEAWKEGYNAAVAQMRRLRDEGDEGMLAPIGEYQPESTRVYPRGTVEMDIRGTRVMRDEDGTIQVFLRITPPEAGYRESPPGVYEAAQVQRNLGHH